jgi:hypothetical protein
LRQVPKRFPLSSKASTMLSCIPGTLFAYRFQYAPSYFLYCSIFIFYIKKNFAHGPQLSGKRNGHIICKPEKMTLLGFQSVH